MGDTESKLQREVQELKAEVRRLRRMIEGGFIIIGLAVVVTFPQLAMLALVIGVLILFAFLVSPVRRMIFASIFQKKMAANMTHIRAD